MQLPLSRKQPQSLVQQWLGVGMALLILAAWFGSLALALPYTHDWRMPWPWLWVLLQTHLYTGLFITAHDGMHGTIAPGNRRLNDAFGWLCATLHAFNGYFRLRSKHHLHHAHAGTHHDPDYHAAGATDAFFPWYFKFLLEYVNLWQLLLMAVTFNVLYRFFFPLENVILFWMLPAVLSTFQLFFFGTWLPHRGMHAPDNRHRSRSQARNHLWAFLSCYFFGYHYEHHDSPGTPWWRLWQRKH